MQQRLGERASMPRYTYVACTVKHVSMRRLNLRMKQLFYLCKCGRMSVGSTFVCILHKQVNFK